MGQAVLKYCLVIAGIVLDVADLGGFPFALDVIVGGVEDDNMAMQAHIRQMVVLVRAGRPVDNVHADQVSRDAVFILAANSYAGGHVFLNVLHGVVDGFPVRLLDPGVGQFPGDGYRFGGVEVEVPANAAAFYRLLGEVLAGLRVEIVTEGVEVFFLGSAGEAQHLSTFAEPGARGVEEVIACNIISLCRSSIFYAMNPEQGRLLKVMQDSRLGDLERQQVESAGLGNRFWHHRLMTDTLADIALIFCRECLEWVNAEKEAGWIRVPKPFQSAHTFHYSDLNAVMSAVRGWCDETRHSILIMSSTAVGAPRWIVNIDGPGNGCQARNDLTCALLSACIEAQRRLAST